MTLISLIQKGLSLRLTIRISLRMQERTVNLTERIMKMEVQDLKS
jgi:hypothetical protein